MLKYRIWLDDEKKMVTCADYLIASDGTVYEIDYYDGCDLIREVQNAYVMRNTEYIYKQGSGVIADKCIFELDIVYCGDLDLQYNEEWMLGILGSENALEDIGIVFYEDCKFQVYFPYCDRADDLCDLGEDSKYGVDLVSHCFLIKADPKYKEFIERIPDVIRPDR